MSGRLLIARQIGLAGYKFLSTHGETPTWHSEPNLADDYSRGGQADALCAKFDAELVWEDE